MKLFINYRREDTAPYAGRLYDRLSAKFGSDEVFIDIDQIEPGEDFVEAINRKVGACEIALVLLGPDWLGMTDAFGRRRLDDPEDFVRMEIVSALQRKIRVIPVLVGGARMPRKEDLPEPLALLSRRNAIELSEARFHADVDRLIEAMEKPRHLPVKETEKPDGMPAPVAQARRSSDHDSWSRTNLFRMLVVAMAAILIVAWLMWVGSARKVAEPVSDSEPIGSATAPSESESVSAATTPSGEEVSRAADQSLPQGSNTISQLIKRDPLKRSFAALDLDASMINEIRERALAGSAEDQFAMGAIYEFGLKSVPPDLAEAATWYRQAAALGHGLASEGLEDLTRTDAPGSEVEELKAHTRRSSRYQKVGSIVLDKMHEQARDAIRQIKP